MKTRRIARRTTSFPEISTPKKFTRRDMIRWGIFGGGAAAFYIKSLPADSGSGNSGGGDGPFSPATTPFVQELPVPWAPNPVAP